LFHKVSIPTPRRIAGTPKGEGGGASKAQILKESMNQNWNFPRNLRCGV